MVRPAAATRSSAPAQRLDLPLTRPCRALATMLLAAAAVVPAAVCAQGNGLHVRTTTFLVSVTVDNDCQISGASALDFGHIRAPRSLIPVLRLGATDQVGSFSVSCSRNTRYTLYLDRGSVAGSSVVRRLMAGASPGNGDRLGYQLYQDPSFATIWGDGSSGSAGGLGAVGSGAAQTYSVYGRILPQDMPAADLYSSVITASLTF